MLLLSKAVFALMIGFFISLICALLFIPILKKIKAEQTVNSYLREAHQKKQGTPTMGGIIMIIVLIVIKISKEQFLGLKSRSRFQGQQLRRFLSIKEEMTSKLKIKAFLIQIAAKFG